MKRLLLLILLVLPIFHNAQTCSNYFIPDSLIKHQGKSVMPEVLSGTCSSPDGAMQFISSPPSSYAWLQSNGYCFSITPTSSFTMCFTFVSTGTDVSLNAGYESSGCFFTTFSGFNLYTCSPSCTLVGNGLTFSGLTPGQCYTWCISGNCFGPGPGFDNVCPYWMDTSPLPIELVSFVCVTANGSNVLQWQCATETNNNYFTIERSSGDTFVEIGMVKGAGNTSYTTSYSFVDSKFDIAQNYYRLKQHDYNGKTVTVGTISVDDRMVVKKIVRIINSLGQDVSINCPGFKILYYQDGSIKRQID
jgi:hypothetical protein